MTNAETPTTEAALDLLLSEPTEVAIRAMHEIEGDLVILGAGGKMGPTLAMMAKRASEAAGVNRRVIAVARFSTGDLPNLLQAAGIEVHQADLLHPSEVSALPSAANVMYLVGQKFGTAGDSARTWAVNAFVPGLVAARYPASRIVPFSTGNVYPLWPSDSQGPTETDPVGPIGEYAQSALARERVFEYFSLTNNTPMAFLRLNYAIEPRYGVIRDIAEKVWAGSPVDLTMGYVNLISQRDANAFALAALGICSMPPRVLNLTGVPAVSVRHLAELIGEQLGKPVTFSGSEAATALLSNANRMVELFGAPTTSLDALVNQVTSWIKCGGVSLGKATHFEEREGKF